MEAQRKQRKRPVKRVLSKIHSPVKLESSENTPLDFLPPEIIKIFKSKAYRFSQNEQIMLTLLAQIIVEILIKEEL